ncbi:MAG TPA: HD domain-containing protein [Solirubrobacteraceae bacterium]|nr:HD domain-containing protein [Solirubrobacteraceae bacterium]
MEEVLIRELTDGDEVDQVLLVREVETRVKRDGSEYLRVTFADRSGQLAAMVWDAIADLKPLLRAGEPVWTSGRYSVHPRYGPQLNLRSLREAQAGSFDPDDLMPGPTREVAQMEAALRELIATVQNRHVRALLERLLGEQSELWQRYRLAPAAKFYHQAYRHGLLEHSLSVAEAVSAMSSTFPGIDRDVAVAGALLHDIGKLDAYEAGSVAIDLTDAGRLQGEIALGYYRVRRAIEDLDGFPPALAEALAHIILSHHGSLEHGSPVVPCTREATLVHMADNLGGRLGSFDRLELELRDGESWSGFDRAIGAGAFFPRHLEERPAASKAA